MSLEKFNEKLNSTPSVSKPLSYVAILAVLKLCCVAIYAITNRFTIQVSWLPDVTAEDLVGHLMQEKTRHPARSVRALCALLLLTLALALTLDLTLALVLALVLGLTLASTLTLTLSLA